MYKLLHKLFFVLMLSSSTTCLQATRIDDLITCIESNKTSELEIFTWKNFTKEEHKKLFFYTNNKKAHILEIAVETQCCPSALDKLVKFYRTKLYKSNHKIDTFLIDKFHESIVKNNLELAQIFLVKNQINAITTHGTPLKIATNNKNKEMVLFLKNHGAK